MVLFYELNSSLEVHKRGEEVFLSWEDPAGNRKLFRKATVYDLLALKIVVEGEDLRDLARREKVSLTLLQGLLRSAVREGLLVKKPSLLQRRGKSFTEAWFPAEEFRRAEVFTLQWHLTQRCDLSCRHCYDRNPRTEVSFKEAVYILDEVYRFCERMRVYGQISFSGGNPFLHPQFTDIYRAAAERGFTLAILGNPVPESWLEKILGIEPPAFYQVSLEGLEDTNDRLRGEGHFRRTLEFLKILKKHEIPASIMLTLHAENLNEVLPLAERLEGLVDTFSFNRLALTGRGSSLSPAEQKTFDLFLEDYLRAAEKWPHLHLKDNLFNRKLYLRGEPLEGGCTGFGCGAAFNFLALLPDGEVHACRKFPSYLGSIYTRPLWDIYWSEAGEAYRRGPEACRGCRLYAVCRGCPAVIATHGLNPFEDRDPFCPGPLTERDATSESVTPCE